MTPIQVYKKDGTPRVTIQSLEYNGELLGERTVTTSVNSPSPIAWGVGDYLTYRGEKYTLFDLPSVTRNSKDNTNGQSIKYNNVKFESAVGELKRAAFLDVVVEDNELHYGLSEFTFFADTAQKLVERIITNMNRIYGEDAWSYNEEDFIDHNPILEDGKTDLSVSISNLTCWDALKLVKSEFDLDFRVTGRYIYVGVDEFELTPEGKDYWEYGKDNGLLTIERNGGTNDKFVTRIRAYGNTTNMPIRYYHERGAWDVKVTECTPSSSGQSVNIKINLAYDKSYFTSNVVFQIGNVYQSATYNEDGCTWFIDYRDDSVIKVGASVRIPRGVKVNNLVISDNNTFTEGGVTKKHYELFLPNNLAVSRLMLPGYPLKSLKEYDPKYSMHRYSEDSQDPYIDSKKINTFGICEKTVNFDGNDDLDDIYPSLENITAQQLINAGYTLRGGWTGTERMDKVISATQIADNGIYNDETLRTIQKGTDVSVSQSSIVFYWSCYVNAKDGVNTYTLPSVASVEWERPSGSTTTSGTFYFTTKVYKQGTAIFQEKSENSIAYGEEKDIPFSACFDCTESSVKLELWIEKNVYCYGGGTLKATCTAYKPYFTHTLGLRSEFDVNIKDIGFDINDYVSESPKICFKSGKCAGREFDINSVKKTDNGYALRCKRTEDDGLKLMFPYSAYNIASGDEFILTGIYMPDVYVDVASERLLAAAKTYLNYNDNPNYTYSPKVDNIFIQRDRDENGDDSIYNTIVEGMVLPFRDTSLGILETIYIEKLSIKEGDSLIPQFTLTLRNEKVRGIVEKMQDKMGKVTTIAVKATDTSEVDELKRKVKNQSADYAQAVTLAQEALSASQSASEDAARCEESATSASTSATSAANSAASATSLMSELRNTIASLPRDTILATMEMKLKTLNNPLVGESQLILPRPVGARLTIMSRQGEKLVLPTQKDYVSCSVEYTDTYGNYYLFDGASIKLQGDSSTAFEKRNYTLRMFPKNADKVVKFGDWIPSKTFHIKAHYTDITLCRSYVCRDVAKDVQRKTPYEMHYINDSNVEQSMYDSSTLYGRMDIDPRFLIDAFPVEVYLVDDNKNPTYYGLYMIAINKNEDNYMIRDAFNGSTAIHLDGNLNKSQGFFHQGINPNWSRFEIRYPEGLRCTDGTVYDGDEGKEIVDGYVKTAILRLNDCVDEIYSYVKDQTKTDAQRRAKFEEYFDPENFIDFLVAKVACKEKDGFNKNTQYISYNGLKWYVCHYDMDFSLGTDWTGMYPMPTDCDVLYDSNSHPFGVCWCIYHQEIRDRFKALRQAGVISAEKTIGYLEDRMREVGYQAYEKNMAKWVDCPVNRVPRTNASWDFVKGTIDAWQSFLYYNDNAVCYVKDANGVPTFYRLKQGSKVRGENVGKNPSTTSGIWDVLTASGGYGLYDSTNTYYVGDYALIPADTSSSIYIRFQCKAQCTGVYPIVEYSHFPKALGFKDGIWFIKKWYREYLANADAWSLRTGYNH